MKIFIDVTNLLEVSFVTGIQRVVREVVIRMLGKRKEEIVLLNYSALYSTYLQVDTDTFLTYYKDKQGDKTDIIIENKVEWEDFKAGDVFFDIDSVWEAFLRRSYLLPILKKRGVRLAVFVHDIIPITDPQYCFGETVFMFMDYIGAYLQHADIIISSTQSTLDAIANLQRKLSMPVTPGYATWLGADFEKQSRSEVVSEKAIEAAQAGNYVLMVGTIEPRKNHKLVLDAFDNQLFAEKMNLIFAGKIGWNVEELQKRIDKHSKLNKQFFYLSGMNDTSIDYLYNNAFCVAFPTFNEGFGLPMIEAFERKTPVLASDIPVMREVGGENADYFDCHDWKSFANKLMNWMKDEQLYHHMKEKLMQYEPLTWDQVTNNMWTALETLKNDKPYVLPKEVKQMVFLTARTDDLLGTLPFVEAFMPFIREIILCCPDKMVHEMQERYSGKLKIKFLTDSKLLGGRQLPADHAYRNFFLRCLAMQNSEIDNVFIMSDDDYRPLHEIDQKVFLKDNKYQAYYFYHLDKWCGNQTEPTSFDESMYRTTDFLLQHNMPLLMYDSHMPQIIDKRIFLEIIDKYPDIMDKGLSDWSIYFNYLSKYYADQVEVQPYVTMAWPGYATVWDWDIIPNQYLFENYYHELYEEENIFAGFSQEYYTGIETENFDKIIKYEQSQSSHCTAKQMFQAYRQNYDFLYGEYPFFGITFNEDGCRIDLPAYVTICELNFTRIPFVICDERKSKDSFSITYNFIDASKNVILEGADLTIEPRWNVLELPIKGTHGGLKGVMEIVVSYHNMSFKNYTKLCVMKKDNTKMLP